MPVMRSARTFVAVGCFVWLLIISAVHAQNTGRGSTVEGDILRGQGAFLQGAGWYNLRTAQANSVNVDATIRWKQDLRRIQRERDVKEAQKKYEKSRNVEQLRQQIAQREQELRTNPSPNDVQSGAALNALVYDLTDPDITSYRWSSSSIALPTGTSVKELIFSFTPHSISTQTSAALSRGVIALSRLDIKEKWPVLLKKEELAKERKDYEDAYIRVRDKVLRGDYAVEEILALDTAINNLKQKVAMEIPLERGFRTEAMKFVDDLRDATRMFDASSVDYAREILTETQDHDAATVQELVEFMSKYRLQFANSDRSPAARVLYGQIYETLRKQADALSIKFDTAKLALPMGETPSGTKSNTFVQIFDGKTLNGWTGDTNIWKVRDGAIVGRISPSANPPRSYISTKDTYRNFVLTARFKPAGGDAGFLFRGKPNWFYALQVPVGDVKPGAFWDESPVERKGKLNSIVNEARAASVIRQNDWNDIKITANGDRFECEINGQPAFKTNYSSGPASGVISLKIKTSGQSTANAEAAFRDIKIARLPD
jgi:hypothetical protein